MSAKPAVRIATFSLLTLALSATHSSRKTRPRESLLILSKQDHTVAIIDHHAQSGSQNSCWQ
jgi:hypothetical protein